MKILILGNSTKSLFTHRAELLDELLLQKFQIVISTPIDDENYVAKKNIKNQMIQEMELKGVKHIETDIDRRGVNPIKDIFLILKYISIIKKEKPEIILSYTIKPNIYGGMVARFLGIEYINNITGLGTSLQGNGLLTKLLKQMYKISFKNSKCIFFQNETNMNFFLNNKLINKKINKIKLIPGSGVNLKRYYPKSKKTNNLQKKILFIGRIMKEKGIKEYLEVAQKIKKEYKNIVEFQILGAYEEEEYKNQIKELEKKSIVKYLGVSKDIREQLKEVDCVINPSWHEGMSNVLLESGAMKKFLIASEIPGCKEIVINNRTGLTFKVKNSDDLEKKIKKYINMDDERKKIIIEELYTHISSNFCREKIIEEYMETIKVVRKNEY